MRKLRVGDQRAVTDQLTFVVNSTTYRSCEPDPRVVSALDVPAAWLRTMVETLSYPRHFVEQPAESSIARAIFTI